MFVASGLQAPFIHPLRLVSRLEPPSSQRDTQRVAPALVRRRHAWSRRDPDAGAPLLLLGADGYGRDVFARLLHGARTTLALALVADARRHARSARDARRRRRLRRWLARRACCRGRSEFVLVHPGDLRRAGDPRGACRWCCRPPHGLRRCWRRSSRCLGAPIVARGVRAIVLTEREQDYVVAARAAGAGAGARACRATCCRRRAATSLCRRRCCCRRSSSAEATLSYVGLGFPDDHADVGHDAAATRPTCRCSIDVPWTLAPAGGDLPRRARREPGRFRVAGRAACTIGDCGSGAASSRVAGGRITHEAFAGIFTPITTPFRADDTLDEAALVTQRRRWMQTPLTGLVVLGSNGEAPQLDDAEADRVDRHRARGVPRDRPLIAGTGRESTRATIAATRRAAGGRRRRRARPHAVVLQVADDQRGVRPPLHRGRRRVARVRCCSTT